MGFEIPVNSAYPHHPKTLHLIALTGKPEADAYPIRLWTWAAEYARDGVVKGGGPQIEVAVRWKGPPGKLSKALQEAGFIESDGKTIHDWEEHTGRAISLYEEKKRKQREKYAIDNGILPEDSSRIPPIRNVLDVLDRNSGHPTPKTAAPDPVAPPMVPKAPPAPLPGGAEKTQTQVNGNPKGFTPAVLRKTREQAHAERLAEVQVVEGILASLSPEVLKSWNDEAAFLTSHLPPKMRPLGIQGFLSKWAKDPASFKLTPDDLRAEAIQIVKDREAKKAPPPKADRKETAAKRPSPPVPPKEVFAPRPGESEADRFKRVAEEMKKRKEEGEQKGPAKV